MWLGASAKNKALLHELDKRKRKENAAVTSQTHKFKGKAHCHESSRLLRCESMRPMLGVENKG